MDVYDRNLMDALEIARTSANTQMEKLCNNRQYIDGCIYQSIRDNIDVDIQLLKSYLYCKGDENIKE